MDPPAFSIEKCAGPQIAMSPPSTRSILACPERTVTVAAARKHRGAVTVLDVHANRAGHGDVITRDPPYNFK